MTFMLQWQHYSFLNCWNIQVILLSYNIPADRFCTSVKHATIRRIGGGPGQEPDRATAGRGSGYAGEISLSGRLVPGFGDGVAGVERRDPL
jgi:hypothetical protein